MGIRKSMEEQIRVDGNRDILFLLQSCYKTHGCIFHTKFTIKISNKYWHLLILDIIYIKFSTLIN